MIVSALVLVIGLAGVGWLAKSDAARAHRLAGAEARACAAALESQFHHALGAVDVLGALARQNGGAIPNFQQVASELQATRPGLVSLELQPGGVIRDIFPRVGNERALGLNVLADPAQRDSANKAIQSRSLVAVAGSLPLRPGELGVVARLPIFLRGRDGRESFWGLVAVSMRFAAAMSQARLGALAAGGNDYCFYIPASAGQKPLAIVTRGVRTLNDTDQEPVRVKNAELRLALRPQGGWFNKTKAGLAALGVVLTSGLLGLLVHTVSRGRALETALAEESCRLVRETEDKKRAEEDYRGVREGTTAAETALMQARFTLQQAESKIVKLQAQLEAEARGARETSDALQAKLAQAELAASELQTRMEAAARTAEASAQAKEAELKQAQTALQPGRRIIQEMETRFDAAAQAAAQAAQAKETELDQAQAALRQAQWTIQEMETRLEAATLTQKQIIAEAQTRFERDQAAIAGLQASLAEAARSAEEAAETGEHTEFTLIHEDEAPHVAEEERIAEDRAAEEVAEAESAALVTSDHASLPTETPPAEVAEPPPASTEESPPPYPASAELSPDAAEPVEELPTKQKPAKMPRRKKHQRDDQMDLFKAPPETEPASTDPARDTAAPAPALEAPELPPDELAAPSVSSPPELETEPEHPAAAGWEETAGQPEFPDLALPEAVFEDLTPAKAETDQPAEETASVAEEAKPASARSFRLTPPVNSAQLRKAVNLMLPLLAGQDPGAKDCFNDNHASFRSAFTPESFEEFEQAIKSGEFGAALEHLKKAAKKHGISVAY